MLKAMLRDQAVEIEEVVTRLLANMLRGLPSRLGLATYAARRQIGDVRGDYLDMLEKNTFGAELLDCFNQCRGVGMTLQNFAYVRTNLEAETPVNFIPTLIVTSALLYCLSAEVRIVADMTFVCREDSEKMLIRMKAAFDGAKDNVADKMDSASYRALIDLAASICVHLAKTALLLPRIVTFDLAVNYPGLKLSQLLYYDPSRVDELISENKVVHPLFFPRDVRALSE